VRADRDVPSKQDLFSFGIWTVGRQGMAFERLDQLVLEYLYRVR
jgi:hypothetical protein